MLSVLWQRGILHSKLDAGSSSFNKRFDGGEASDNSMMYDNLTITEGKRAYCNNCFEYIGNVESGVLGAKTIRRLKELGVYES